MQGAAWNRMWRNLAFKIFAGWEFNLWTDLHSTFREAGVSSQTVLRENISLRDNSDVNLQGFTGGAELRF